MFRNLVLAMMATVSLGIATSAMSATQALSPEMRALPFSQLGIYTSEPNETERDFLLRLAPVLAAYTASTGEEACGVIGEEDGRFGVVLGTNHAQIGCLAGEAGIVTGMTFTGETIHSHPAGYIRTIRHADRSFAFATHAGPPDHKNFDGGWDTFSDNDYAGSPGYLVSHGHLLYQNKPGMREVVGEISTCPEANLITKAP